MKLIINSSEYLRKYLFVFFMLALWGDAIVCSDGQAQQTFQWMEQIRQQQDQRSGIIPTPSPTYTRNLYEPTPVKGKIIRVKGKETPTPTWASFVDDLEEATETVEVTPTVTTTPVPVKIKIPMKVDGVIRIVEVEVTPTPAATVTPSATPTATAGPITPATGVMAEIRDLLIRSVKSSTDTAHLGARHIARIREEFMAAKIKSATFENIFSATEAMEIQTEIQSLSSIATGGKLRRESAIGILKLLFPQDVPTDLKSPKTPLAPIDDLFLIENESTVTPSPTPYHAPIQYQPTRQQSQQIYHQQPPPPPPPPPVYNVPPPPPPPRQYEEGYYYEEDQPVENYEDYVEDPALQEEGYPPPDEGYYEEEPEYYEEQYEESNEDYQAPPDAYDDGGYIEDY